MNPMSSPRARIKLAAGLVVPLGAFLALHQVLGNATGALAIADAIPMLWVLAIGIRQRRIDRVALLAVAVFALALVLTIAFGGSSLPLELRRSVFPGALGLACLISLAMRRPLLVTIASRIARARPGPPLPPVSKLETPGARKTLTTTTAIIGVTCITDAAAQITLALTVSTSSFAELARVASYTIIGAGLAVGMIYLRWARTRLRDKPPQTHPTSGASAR